MIFGIGIDIVAIERIRRMYERFGNRFLQRVFTDAEIAYCEKKFDIVQHLSARFAAKEATSKALGTGIMHGVGFKNIEVTIDHGPPFIRLSNNAHRIAQNLGVNRIHLSLTHDHGCAAAVVVLEVIS